MSLLQTVIFVYTMKLTAVLFFLLGYVSADFQCGQCQCHNTLVFVVCNGDSVDTYPILTPQDKKLVQYVEIKNSYMFVLPIMSKTDYPQLTLAGIFNNNNLHCDYVRQWAEALVGQGSVNTDCILYGITSVSEEQTPTHSLENWSTVSGNDVNVTMTATSQTPENFILIVTLFSIIMCVGVIVIVVILVMRCIKLKRISHSSVNNSICNSIYTMTTMHWDESET